jgi:hypothetical protein
MCLAIESQGFVDLKAAIMVYSSYTYVLLPCSKNGGGLRPPTPLGQSGAEVACRS